MNKFKRMLALFLVLCTVMSVAPFSVFAADVAEVPTEETTAASEETTAPAEQTEAPVEETTAPTEETEVPVEETTAPTEQTETPTEETAAPTEEKPTDPADETVPGEEEIATMAIKMNQKPNDGKTTDQPFKAGTGGSQKFRIPGIVSLNNGRIVASCDARWDHTGDGAGLDTIVSSSADNGANWHYTFANYLGDNGNTKNVYSTSFIDPAIATDGTTAYMIADLFPAGIALNTSKYSPVAGHNGLDSQGRLMLRENTLNINSVGYNTRAAKAKYDFYLENGSIYNTNGTKVEGYTVDAYFNITGKGVNTNLFCADSPYQPYPTNYLYLTSSTDGQNWSEPQLLNLKEANEQTFLVGPGNGTYDANSGNLIFTAYEHTSGHERACLIWRGSDGVWHRTADATGNERSSESTAVVLENGTVRCFYRGDSNKLQYTDYAWNGTNYVPSKMEQTFDVTRTINNQMSAIKYSKTIKGEEVLLVSTAATSDKSRYDGHIYAFTVNADNSMKLLSSYDVVKGSSDSYSYSCLTELGNGDIGLLYENSGGSILYEKISIAKITNNAVFDTETPDPIVPEPPVETDQTVTDPDTDITVTAPGLIAVSVTKSETSTPAEGYTASVTYEITLNGGTYTGKATVKIPVDAVFADCTEFIGHVDQDSFEVPAPVDGYFTVDVPHFSAVTISGKAAGTSSGTSDVTLTVGQADTRMQNDLPKKLTAADITNNGTGIVDVTIKATPKTTGATTEYTLGSKTTSINSGEQYVIAFGTNMLVSNGAGQFANGQAPASGAKVDANALWTISQSGNGYTISQNIGGTIYYLANSQKQTGNPFTGYQYSYTLVLSRKESIWTFDNQTSSFYQHLQTSKQGLFSGSDAFDNYYLTPASNWSLNKNTATVDLYNVTETPIDGTTTYDHTITFTGKSAGKTTVTVGNTQYNITVTNKKVAVNLPVNGQATFTNNGEVTKEPNTGIATYAQTGDQLTITGVAFGKTEMTVGTTDYIITVENKLTIENTPFLANSGAGKSYKNDAGETVTGKVTKLTTSARLSYQLQLDPSVVKGQKVEWTVDNPAVAIVAQDGTVTGVAPGETRVNATVGGVTYSIPVVIKDFAKQDPQNPKQTKIYDFYTAEITNTTVWYVWNCGRTDPDPKFHELQEGEAIYVAFDDTADSACNFFAKPDQKHALTQMAAPGSQGHYFKIHDDQNKIDMSADGFVKNPAAVGYHETQMWDEKTVTANVQNAINRGCDGGMGFTRPGDGKLNQNPNDCNFVLSFHSDPLLDVAKTVRGVLDKDNQWHEYTEGMTANIGDVVYYQIVVTKYASKFDVNYTNVNIKDIMDQGKRVILLKNDRPGAEGTVLSNPYYLTKEIQADQLAEGTHTYYAKHQITEDDLDQTLVNHVTLSYAYKSGYSSGQLSGSAEAAATITATSFKPKDIVIDFGLPVTVHYDEWGHNVQLQPTGSAKYGDVKVTAAQAGGWDVTYTPTTVLKGMDTVTLTAVDPATKATAEYKFNVYPATTVYYEEGFAEPTTGFTGGEKGTAMQQTQLAGETGKNVFGYDAAYQNETGMSNGTQATSSTLNDLATFVFTGTGVDLYANCDSNTGVMLVMIKNKETGKLVKFYQVDTRVNPGNTGATNQQQGDAYNLPVVAVHSLPHGTYEVLIRHVARSAENPGGAIHLDGYRVYDTLNDLNNAAYPDSEKNPKYLELRDQVLAAVGVTDQTESIYNKANGIIDQVYNSTGVSNSVVIIGKNDVYNDANMKDLLDNGPKNELFLYPGQVITFTLKQAAQIGLKAINGEVTYTLNSEQKTITTATDMFYHDLNGEVTIQNTSGKNILSITLLKYFGSPATVFGEITQDQMVYALRTLGYEEPIVHEDASLKVSLVDNTGAEVASTVLTANGNAGEVNTFTAEQILAAAREQMPEKYAFVNEQSVQGADVAFGEEGTVTIQVGKTATLNVTYVKRELKRVGFFRLKLVETVVETKSIVGVQTNTARYYRVSGKQIRDAAPDGTFVLAGATSKRVPFGSEANVKVIVK